MEMRPNFPSHMLEDVKRQAELAVYHDLEASALPGAALYSVRAGPNGPEVDFVVWVEGVGRFVIEVKGGRYHIVQGQWFLDEPCGRTAADSPSHQAWYNMLSLRNYLGERLGGRNKPFLIAALLFPDMEPDPGIEAAVTGGRVQVLWGAGDVAGRLSRLAGDVRFPPSSLDIQREAALLCPGIAQPELALPSAVHHSSDGRYGLDTQQVIIQHVDTVNIYTQIHPAEVSHG